MNSRGKKTRKPDITKVNISLKGFQKLAYLLDQLALKNCFGVKEIGDLSKLIKSNSNTNK